MKLSYRPKTFIPAPEGEHRAVCVDYTDLGVQTLAFNGEERQVQMVRISWQLDELMPQETGEPGDRRFLVSKRYTASLHPSAEFPSSGPAGG